MSFNESFDNLEDMLSELVKKADDTLDIMEDCAKEFVNDVRKLPRPRSRIMGAGHTHLLDTITYKRKKGVIEAGWGKYYGPMLERGTKKMRAQPHFEKTFEKNKEKYYKKMIDYFYK